MNPLQGLKTVFDFYGLPIKDADEKLKTNGVLKKNKTLYFERPMEWMDVLTPQHVRNIEHVCAEAMQLWGYRPVSVSLLANVKSDTFVPLRTLPLLVK